MLRLLKLQVLLLLLGLVIGGLCLGDVVLKARAEDALAAAVEREAPGTSGTTADIGSFPFIGRLVVEGEVPVVRVRAEEAMAGQLPLRDVRLVVTDVRLDTRDALDGKVRITSAGAGSLAAIVTERDLAGRIPGLRVGLTPGRADVTGPGGVKGELVTSSRGRLLVRAAGRTLAELPLAAAGLLPCEPEVTIVQSALSLTCSFDEVPPVLLRAASGA